MVHRTDFYRLLSASNVNQKRGRNCVRVILISILSANIVLVVHAFGILSRVALGLFLVDIVQPFSFDELINLSTSNANKELLSELVRDWLAYEISR